MNRWILSLLIAATTFSHSRAQDFNKAGRTAMQFLKIGIGARMAAMGEAGVANMEDINSVFWNPAAIANIEGAEAAFNYSRWFGDLSFTAGAVGFQIGTLGVVSLNYVALDYGHIDEALVSSPSGGVDTRTGETFGGNDLAVGLALSRKFTDKLAVGVNLKYVREELFNFSSGVAAFDVGTYYDTGWRGIRLAMSAQNFGKQPRWLHTREDQQQEYELPLIFRIGWSIDLLGDQNLFLGGSPEKHRFSFNMDAIHTNDYAERLHLGGEYAFSNFLVLRGGYRFNYEEGNLAFGVGLQPKVSGLNLHVDYAYVSHDFLDSPHRFSMIVNF
ncbi:MAG TPA: PorV/PorQ family protein [bacterium]